MSYKTMDCVNCPTRFVTKKKNLKEEIVHYKGDEIVRYYYSCPECKTKHITVYDEPEFNHWYIRMLITGGDMRKYRKYNRKKSDEFRVEYEIAKVELKRVRNEIEKIGGNKDEKRKR